MVQDTSRPGSIQRSMFQRERYGRPIFPVSPTSARQASAVARSNAKQFVNVAKKDPPEETMKTVMWNFFLEYMESSSIHGFYHLTVPKRTPLEYLVWVCLLAVGVTGAYVIGMTTVMRYQQNPTVISIEKNYQDWNTTFPSMTICPIDSIDEYKLETLVEQYSDSKTRDAVSKILTFLSQNGTYGMLTPELLELAPYFPIKPAEYVDYIFKVKLDFEYLTHESSGGGFNLTENWSELGMCHTYNSIVSIYNNYQYWKRNDWNISTSNDIRTGNPLDGEIFSEVTEMNSLIKVYVHGYNDVLDISSRPKFLKDKEYLEYDLGIWSIYSTQETRGLSISQRRCRFVNESDLYVSPAYTYNLCRMQCRAAKAVELCGCAPHYLRFNPRNLLSKLRDAETGEKIKCSCLPPCDDIAFVSHKEMPMSWFLSPLFKLGVTNYPRTRLKRDILFGLTDLFVSIGGTAGLFLGCSVLSFVEIFYYFTLRLFWFLHFRYKQRSNA